MALTNKMLKAMNLEDAQIEQIIEAHRDSINGLTETRDNLQADLDKANAEIKRLQSVEKDLVKANAKIEEAEETAQKLKDLQKEFSDYKAEVNAKNVTESKSKQYKELLTKAGIPEKRQNAILKVTDLEAVDLDKDGKISNAKELLAAIDEEWAEFKVTENPQGAKTPNPPENGGGSTFEKMPLAEKMSYANEHPNDAEVKAWLK
jgi:chromosome segregation ATPase